MSLNELALSEAKLLCHIVGEKRGRQVPCAKVKLTGDAKQNQIRSRLFGCKKCSSGMSTVPRSHFTIDL